MIGLDFYFDKYWGQSRRREFQCFDFKHIDKQGKYIKIAVVPVIAQDRYQWQWTQSRKKQLKTTTVDKAFHERGYRYTKCVLNEPIARIFLRCFFFLNPSGANLWRRSTQEKTHYFSYFNTTTWNWLKICCEPAPRLHKQTNRNTNQRNKQEKRQTHWNGIKIWFIIKHFISWIFFSPFPANFNMCFFFL